MNNSLDNKYFVKHGSESYADICTKYDGVRILQVEGLFSQGEAVNVYNEQWTDTQEEDFMITTMDNDNNPVVIHKNQDIKIVFVVSNRYANGLIDVGLQHDAFVNYMSQGEIWIKSIYSNKEAKCALLSSYTPNAVKLHRNYGTYILGELTMHVLDIPQVITDDVSGDLYVGLGDATLSAISQLVDADHFDNIDNPSGNYTYDILETGYVWVCSQYLIESITSGGYIVPITDVVVIGEYRCYRTQNQILPHTMQFKITS